MLDVVYVSDNNSMGKMKSKWIKWLIETLVPEAKVRQAFTPNDVFNTKPLLMGDETVYPEYNVVFKEGKPEGILKDGQDGDNTLWDVQSTNPDVIICDDLMRSNTGKSIKVYNRSRILYESLRRNIQTHIIAPDVTMNYAASLELDPKVRLPLELTGDHSNLHIWYGVNDIKDYDKITAWNKMKKDFSKAHVHRNIITGICYAYLKTHKDEIRSSLQFPEIEKFGYYGFWRTGVLLDNVITSGVDIIIGSFKWRPHCDTNGIEWLNCNKSLEEIYSIITKAYIPYEGKKNDIQHIFRQFEGLVYARDGVEYDPDYPEDMRVYSFDDPKLKALYNPIISEFIGLLKSTKTS